MYMFFFITTKDSFCARAQYHSTHTRVNPPQPTHHWHQVAIE